VFLNTNSRNELRGCAVMAAQQVAENLRRQDPVDLPDTGSSAAQLVVIGTHEFEVVSRFCTRTEFCDLETRHIEIEVSFGGRIVYTVETVLTRMH
jgi:hypothetical protein